MMLPLDPNWIFLKNTIFFLKNTNPLEVIYRDVAKFDVENPIIGSLLTQLE